LLKSRTQQPQTSAEKRKFITENRILIENIERGCKIMNLPIRTYYYKPKKKPSEKVLLERME